MPDDTLRITETMETQEQASHKSKIGERAMGHTLHKSVPHIPAVHFSGSRQSFSEESDGNYDSVSGAHAARFG